MSIEMSSAASASLYNPFYPKLSNAISTRSYEQNIGYKSDQVNDHIRGMSRNNSFFSATSLAFRKGIIGLGLNIQSNTGIKIGKWTLIASLKDLSVSLEERQGEIT